jgi:hypothetical protein
VLFLLALVRFFCQCLRVNQSGKFSKLNESSKTQLQALFLELMNGFEEEKIQNRCKHVALAKYRSVLDTVEQELTNPQLITARACVDALKAVCEQQAVVFLHACAAVSPELHAVGKHCLSMIEEQVKMFTLVYLESRELEDALVISCLEAMTDARDAISGCDSDSLDNNPALHSHFVMLSSAAPALCWVCHPGLPAELLTDVLNALPVFGQRLEALGSAHVDFFHALKGVLRALLFIMNQYYADGVAWSIDALTHVVVTGRFRSQTDDNKIFQTDVDFVGLHGAYVAGPVERLVQASKGFGQYLQKQVPTSLCARFFLLPLSFGLRFFYVNWHL